MKNINNTFIQPKHQLFCNNSFKIDKKIKQHLLKLMMLLFFSKLIGVYNKMKFDKVGISEKADM